MTQSKQESISERTQAWWERDGCSYDAQGQLLFGQHRVTELATRYGTPSYFYDEARIRRNVERLQEALGSIGLRTRLLYAMKSNRCPEVLQLMRTLGLGLDICSPGELLLARACGFAENELSFTAGCLSRADYEQLAAAPGVHINADSLTAIRRLAEYCPGREIGLRINPSAGLGYGGNALVCYSGEKPTKFGIYLDRFKEALALASDSGLKITTLHCHTGCGFLTPQLPALRRVLERALKFLSLAPGVSVLNLGGGLGIPLKEGDLPLDLQAWSELITSLLGSKRDLKLEFEPGDYLVKDAGLLMTEVTQVEEKAGRVFVGLNAGFNLHPEPVFYRLPLEPAPARLRAGDKRRVTLAGNVNEALDLWMEDCELPPVEPDDILCLLNAGGYGASMASNHCLRGGIKEILLSANNDTMAESNSFLPLAKANKWAWDRLYASVPDSVWGAAPLPFLESFRTEFRSSVTGPRRFLDAGCGEGRNLPFLLSCADAETHAIDASMHALAKIPPAVKVRVQSRCSDLGETGYPTAYFDAITLLDVVETIPDRERVLKELNRVLKPGGILLCNIPGMDDGVAGKDMSPINEDAFLYRGKYYFRFHSRGEAETLLHEAGFEVLRCEPSRWEEEPHPGFRNDKHEHTSLVFLVRKPG